MTLSEQEINEYILEYYSHLIEDPKERERLVSVATQVVGRNLKRFGTYTSPRLHDTLSAVLDYGYLALRRTVSLDEDLDGDGFNLLKVIPSATEAIQPIIDLSRGSDLVGALNNAMPSDEFNALIEMTGGIENLTCLLAEGRLTSNEVLMVASFKHITWLNGQPQDVRDRYLDFNTFVRQGIRYGKPIKSLDSVTIPIIRRAVLDVYLPGADIRTALQQRGFSRLIELNGLSRILMKTNPELFHKVPYLHKWKNKSSLLDTGLRAIEEALYRISGYQEAEKTGNRNLQVNIINELIKSENKLKEYFENAGLRQLMDSLVDPTGEYGIRKHQSPKALLEFYSDKKGLNWFDRTQEKYVQAWRITENGMWQRGEQSVRLGIEAIEDVLYELPGYKEAERTNNRDMQMLIIGDLISRVGSLFYYFREKGLRRMMTSMLDPKGVYGLRKQNSPEALLKFYSERKGLKWFDRSQYPHIASYMGSRLKMVYKMAA